MERSLYIAMSGARQTELAMANNTNNLANVSTTGFRADLAAFQDLPLYGPGYPSRVYAQTEQPGIDFNQGAVIATGNELDIAINGKGWIAVQARDGSEAYTRAGNFHISELGILETASGNPVMGANGPIAIPPAEKVEIGDDGTVSVRSLGERASTLNVVDRIKLVNPDQANLVKREDGLLQQKDGVVAEIDPNIRVLTAVVESSNVNAVEAMVNMISLSRHFEMQIKMMKTVEETESANAQLMRLS